MKVSSAACLHFLILAVSTAPSWAASNEIRSICDCSDFESPLFGLCIAFQDLSCPTNPGGPLCVQLAEQYETLAGPGGLPLPGAHGCGVDPVPVCTNTPADCTSLAGGGWVQVRYVPPGNSWHPSRDGLAGTEIYGNQGDPTQSWSINFEKAEPGYDQFLFATGDCARWLVTDVSTVMEAVPYENADKTILSSSCSSIPYEAKWYNRFGKNTEDPWISITDHFTAIHQGNILYGENGYGGYHASNILPNCAGASVYVRKQ
uniref:Uncharacterized protein n=1 Tax=Helicotheca tamesis TaxID=374047 RepID=A0A6U0EQV0_9STRA|mmetsp:Transcript_13092/g.18037  ORF Transcript_13092/g.18037 Transcript_13092/m.18037 type:complete len:260 (+) Transcript_13092:129-908(+)|eukprot:CAMPEP_0185724198 /NCGR_PEP_ID=MMETSP1171-20130828/753_1 /TAXON_ID=374046 /ORGANISM="Helicotheca tamensis, Strain CCMP826" /LENGTH=259 /DNA_ID=CAMNT_0028391997 /DNA_START=58 /DNA_END=837 /DNA_ORIENTATION=-